MKTRDMFRLTGALVVECPHCKGDGEHHGPVPYRNCIRCGGFGTIVLLGDAQPEGGETP
jgi:hypothetical protein